MHWREIPYSTQMVKVGEYEEEVFVRAVCVFDNRPNQLTTEQKADARLISSAPDLPAACKAFVEAWEKSLQLEKTDVALRMAKQAIEKAQYNNALATELLPYEDNDHSKPEK